MTAMSDPLISALSAGTDPEPGEPGHPDTPMPPPSLGWTLGLTDDPYDYSQDPQPGEPGHPDTEGPEVDPT